MRNLQDYLNVVPLWALIAIPMLLLSTVWLLPSRLRLRVALVLTPIMLFPNRAEEMGVIFTLAKIAIALPYALILAGAWRDVRMVGRMPGILWIYIGLALVSPLYVITTIDAGIALAHRVNWLVLTLAAIALARVTWDNERLAQFLLWITVGCAIALAVGAAHLFIEPSTAFRAGGRFRPWGTNPESMTGLIVVCFSLALYFVIWGRRSVGEQVLMYSSLILAAAMLVLTATRTTFVVAIVAALPSLAPALRRPFVMIFSVVVGILAIASVFWVTDFRAESTERFLDMTSQRPDHVIEYFTLVIGKRPWLGLMGTTGESYFAASEIGYHTHNAYTGLLYVGGLSYALPWLLMMAVTVHAMSRVWWKARYTGFDAMLLRLLAFLMVGIYLAGLPQQNIFFANDILAFMHIYLSSFFIIRSREVSSLMYGPLQSS